MKEREGERTGGREGGRKEVKQLDGKTQNKQR
jgi:hypothetical protein